MPTINYFNYSALIIQIIILISIFQRRLIKGKANKFLIITTIEIFVTTIFSTASVYIDNLGASNVLAKYISHWFYLLLHNFTSILYFCFLVSLTDTWHKIKQHIVLKIFLFLPILINVFLFAVNFFVPKIFYIDPVTELYVRGPYFILLYLNASISIIYGIVHIIKRRYLFSKSELFYILSLYPLFIIAAAIQFFFPQIKIEMFCHTLAILLVTYTIQKPEELLNAETKFGNNMYYTNITKKAFINGKDTIHIVINITNYNSLREMTGYETNSDLSARIASIIEKINNEYSLNAELFYIRNGEYRMIVEEKCFDKVDITVEKLNDTLKRPLPFQDLKLTLIACVCIIRCPHDISDFDSLILFSKDLNNAFYYTGNVLYASSLYHPDYYVKKRNINKIIERGISNENFVLYFQPIYSVKDKCFKGAEALLRLKDNDYGILYPDMFLPAAEKNGMIHRIGEFVFSEVCRFIASKTFDDIGLEYVEVNLSAAECMQEHLSETIISTLTKFNVSPSKLSISIPETAISQSKSQLTNTLDTLVNAGVSITLDDFGKGYSNLQKISQLPFRAIKLDKSFADNSNYSKANIILESILNLAKALNLETVIGGVETEASLKQFERLNCDYVQGYYFAEPMPEENFTDFIKKSFR